MTPFPTWMKLATSLQSFLHDSASKHLLRFVLKSLGKTCICIKRMLIQTIYNVLSLCSSKDIIVFLKNVVGGE